LNFASSRRTTGTKAEIGGSSQSRNPPARRFGQRELRAGVDGAKVVRVIGRIRQREQRPALSGRVAQPEETIEWQVGDGVHDDG
jgi:hypothetical protein